MSKHISNCFVIACNIQIVIRMLRINIKVLNTRVFNGKIGNRLQIALPLAYLILPNVPPPPAYQDPPSLYSGLKSISLWPPVLVRTHCKYSSLAEIKNTK